MKPSNFIVLSFILLFQNSVAEKHYNGYRVYTVKSTLNHTQYQALVELQNQAGKIDFWSDPSRSRSTDMMVPPDEIFRTENYLKLYGMEYEVAIPDVQGAVEKEKSYRSKRQDPEMNWREYKRLNVIHGWLDALGTHNPRVVKIDSIGSSTEGRDLKMLKIVANPARNNPIIYVDGGIHSREWISPAVVTYIIGKLMSAEPEDRDLVENIDWYFVPVLNPDGYEYTHTEDRLWRKSRSKHNGADCIGVDLNRNFDFHWGEVGVKEDPCANTYPGPYAFSEPEANATATFLFANRNRIRAYLTFHSYSQLWLTPYGYTEDLPSDYDQLEGLGEKATRALEEVHGTEYQVGAPSHILYLFGGSSQDWARRFGNVTYSYTIELRDDGENKFLLPGNEILPSGEETWEAVKVVARHIIQDEEKRRDDNENENDEDLDESKK